VKPSRRVKELLVLSGLYRPLRRLSSLARSKEVAQARSSMANLISSFVPPNSLVFDIGANVGSFAEIYAGVPCRVVAVEPNADCVRQIQLTYPNLPIQTLQAAVGSRCGLATLHVSDVSDATSTLSSEWINTMERQDERFSNKWNREDVVPILTLDSLIAHFGQPYYIKIDVEGYELEVLRGLSSQPPLLSFEFHKTYLQNTLDCLDLPVFSDGSVFNLIVNPVWGYHERFEKQEWISKDELRNLVSSFTTGDATGDIFVKAR
jgi:FkbM family methyltransferase